MAVGTSVVLGFGYVVALLFSVQVLILEFCTAALHAAHHACMHAGGICADLHLQWMRG